MSRSRGFLVAALLAFGAGAARAQSNPAPGVPPEAPVASRGGSVELAVFGGVGGPVGPAGVSAAFLPLFRLAVGLALGSVSVENDVDYGRRSRRPALRLAPFVRGYVVDRPAWRLGLGLDAVHGEEVTRHAGTAEDGTPALIFWRRGSANRGDATVLVELVRGDLALRLEAGLGRVFGNASCAARFDLVSVPCREPVLGQSRPQPEVTESASSWRPSLLLALAPVGGRHERSPDGSLRRRTVRRRHALRCGTGNRIPPAIRGRRVSLGRRRPIQLRCGLARVHHVRTERTRGVRPPAVRLGVAVPGDGRRDRSSGGPRPRIDGATDQPRPPPEGLHRGRGAGGELHPPVGHAGTTLGPGGRRQRARHGALVGAPVRPAGRRTCGAARARRAALLSGFARFTASPPASRSRPPRTRPPRSAWCGSDPAGCPPGCR